MNLARAHATDAGIKTAKSPTNSLRRWMPLCALSVLIAAVANVSAQNADTVLSVYPLTPEQVTAIDVSDGRYSSVWTDGWASRDSLRIAAAGTVVIAKAGASSLGLYLSVTILDSQRVCPPETAQVAAPYDWLEIMWDTLATADMREQFDDIAWYGGSSISKSSTVFLFNPNTACVLDTTVIYSQFANWIFITPSTITRRMSFNQMSERGDGVLIDRVILDDSTRAVEMFVPWIQMGRCTINEQGGLCGTLRSGRKFAFTLAYNDRRMGPDTTYRLCWRGASPMDGIHDPSPAPEKVRAWGELELTGDIDAAGCSQRVLSATRASQPAALKSSGTYDIRGRKISSPDASSMMIIKWNCGGTQYVSAGISR